MVATKGTHILDPMPILQLRPRPGSDKVAKSDSLEFLVHASIAADPCHASPTVPLSPTGSHASAPRKPVILGKTLVGPSPRKSGDDSSGATFIFDDLGVELDGSRAGPNSANDQLSIHPKAQQDSDCKPVEFGLSFTLYESHG